MFGTERNLDMIKKKVSKTKAKAKAKSKVKSKTKAKKVSKKVSKKIKNPVYLDFEDQLKEYLNKSHKIRDLISNNTIVEIRSNNGASYGLLKSEQTYDSVSYFQLCDYGLSRSQFQERILKNLYDSVYILKTYSHQMPDRDDLSLIAENNDYLGNELFWEEYDEFKKDKFKKLIDFQFILGDVDKVDVENNRIYVRRLKQVKNK